MGEKRDPKFSNWSTIGACLNLLATIVALIALVTTKWANLSGPVFGYMSPFMICQDVHGGTDRCERGGLGPYRQTWASYVAAAGAIFSTLFLALGFILGALVVAMHHAKHQICVKFRHAVFMRMISSSGASFVALVSVICFILETKIFLRMQSNDRTRLSWSFYFEIITFILASIVGVIAGVEWRWARKLGGDPTVYTRDPEGTKADVIVNQNFADGPRTKPATNKRNDRSQPPRPASGGLVSNGIAMTNASGIPYMVTTNGRNTNGKANGRVAFDPNRIPGRSSLRRPRAQPPPEDNTDANAFALHNPAFTNTSPSTLKKKVRIYTQSTAV